MSVYEQSRSESLGSGVQVAKASGPSFDLSVESFMELPLDDREARITRLREFISEHQAGIRQRHDLGSGGGEVTRELALLADYVLRGILAYSIKKTRTLEDGADVDLDSKELDLVLVALGGYGRSEMSPKSDLDVMILYSGKLNEQIRKINSEILHLLWDTGFEVGHSVRSVDDAIDGATSDVTMMTSMLESRRVAGSPRIFDEYFGRLMEKIRADDGADFFRAKEQERLKRYRNFGSDVYELEPHVKEGAGGLRDYSAAMWLAMVKFDARTPQILLEKGLLEEEDFLRIGCSLDFLLRVRNELHFHHATKEDRLNVDHQGIVARSLGYKDKEGSYSVELFMQDYYANALVVRRFYDHIFTLWSQQVRAEACEGKPLVVEELDDGLRLIDGEIYLPDGGEDWFRENPSRLMELIWISQKSGNLMAAETQKAVRSNLDLIDDEFCRSPAVSGFFLAICKDLKRVGKALRKMDELGMLERYIPEYKEIQGIIRFHLFHRYPVHEHTLRALENLGRIDRLNTVGAEFLRQAVREVRRPEVVSLGLFLHDIGKGREGLHVEWGVRISRDVCHRLGLSEEDSSEIEFFVANHLRMSHLSQYRDIEDQEIIEDFAMEIESHDRLGMLYVITFADVSAVAPNVWNDWKSALLVQLYIKAGKALEQSAVDARLKRPEEYWKGPKVARILEHLSDGIEEQVENHLRGMSERYVTTFSSRDIARHIDLASEFRPVAAPEEEVWLSTVCWKPQKHPATRVVVCTQDCHGLFAIIAGVLASHGLSIARAQLFTREDGCVIDTLEILDFHVFDTMEMDESVKLKKWRRVEQDLRDTLNGRKDVAEMVRAARCHFMMKGRGTTDIPAKVYFDNNVSRTHTVIDLHAPDRLGLLYDVTSTMANLGLDIDTARITTDARKAIDAFYVTRGDGQKIAESEFDSVSQALQEALTSISPGPEDPEQR